MNDSAPVTFSQKLRRLWSVLCNPSPAAEIVLWIILVALTIGIRVYLAHLIPVTFWSEDGGSYTRHSVFNWFHNHEWITDGRRGPVYSLFITAAMTVFGGFHKIMIAQHILGALSVIMGLVALRLLHTRKAMVPLFLVGWSYAVYGLPLSLEQILRNESLLFFFSSLTFCAWIAAIRFRSITCFGIAALGCGFVGLTKSFVLGPCLLFLLISAWVVFRQQSWKPYLAMLVCLFGYWIPTGGNMVLKRLATQVLPPEPQDGVLFYGRTAQFTYLEGGKYPEIKAQIRDMVIEYRDRKKLDNNWILKRSVVPYLDKMLEAQGKTAVDLNKLCRELAVEGVLHHPWPYAKQVLGDLEKLNFDCGRRTRSPTISDISSAHRNLEGKKDKDPLLEVPQTLKTLKELEKNKHLLSHYHTWIDSAWLFRVAPVFMATLAVLLMCWVSPREYRTWWIGAAAVWFCGQLILCTIGRPLDRYLMPTLPIMFIALGSGFIFLWNLLDKRLNTSEDNSRRA